MAELITEENSPIFQDQDFLLDLSKTELSVALSTLDPGAKKRLKIMIISRNLVLLSYVAPGILRNYPGTGAYGYCTNKLQYAIAGHQLEWLFLGQ